MKANREPKAVQEVRQWKGEAYREVAHLPLKDAIRKRIDDCVRADSVWRGKRAAS